MAEHVAITDPDIHEPKGAASAAVNTTYVGNGSGSGLWEKIHGWGQYQDTNTTVGTPTQTLSPGVRTKFINDGGTLTQEKLPSDAVNPFWDVANNKHTPISAFDTYDLRISFVAENYGGTDPYLICELDIGAPIGAILEESRVLIKGGGAQGIVLSWPVFTGNTYLANGGEIYLTYNGTGTVDIYKNSVLIKRTGRNA